jgi:hypothetical protein
LSRKEPALLLEKVCQETNLHTEEKLDCQDSFYDQRLSFSLNVTIASRVKGILLVSFWYSCCYIILRRIFSYFKKYLLVGDKLFHMGVSDNPKTFNFCFHLVVMYTLRKLTMRNKDGRSSSHMMLRAG